MPRGMCNAIVAASLFCFFISILLLYYSLAIPVGIEVAGSRLVSSIPADTEEQVWHYVLAQKYACAPLFYLSIAGLLFNIIVLVLLYIMRSQTAILNRADN